MSKGIPALSNLPQINLILPTLNEPSSIESFKGLANIISKLQSDNTPNGTYSNLTSRGNNPYDSSIWDITITSGEYSCVFVSENINEDTNLIGRAALSSRRKLDISKADNFINNSVKSFLALLNFIENLEDTVAQTGNSAEGDGTYTNISLRGNTPFQTHEWTVVKLADSYTLSATLNSN